MRRHIPATFILAGLIALGALLLPALASALPNTGVEGQVTDSGTHEPISGAKVCATSNGGGGEKVCELTEPSGKYKIEGLKTEEYRVEFTAPQHEPKTSTVTVNSGAFTEANAELEEVGQGAVSGRATNASNGQGAGGVEVCIYALGQHCVETNGNGEYTLSEIPVGSYQVYFFPASACEEEQGEKVRCQAKSNYILQSVPVKVKSGQTEIANAALRAGGQISGTVTNASITHPGLAKIEVCATKVTGPEEYGGGGCAYTSSGGQYTINGLENGFYKVKFSGEMCSIPKKGHEECSLVYITQYYQGQQTFKNGQTVTVTVGSNTGGINESLREAFPTTPAVTAAPALTGTAVIGSTLTCSQGSWSHEPTYLLYQWLRNGTVIAGQTGATYTLQTADLGSSITCVVTAGNGAGAVSATSNAIAVPKPIAVAAGTASVKGNVAMLKLTCTGAAACTGTLKLVARVRQGRRMTNITVGTKRFSIAVAKSATIRVPLNGKGRSLLGKAGKRGLKVKLAGSGVKGRVVNLKPLRAKHKKK